MISVKREKYSDAINYIDNISSALSEEVDLGHSYAPDLDHDQFFAMEEIGSLCVVTAKKDGEIVGFHISSIQNDIFFKTKKTAYVLFYFLDKNCRGNGNGLKLFEFADNEFKKEGADRAFMSRKTHINNEKLFTKLGYNLIESNYEKYYD